MKKSDMTMIIIVGFFVVILPLFSDTYIAHVTIFASIYLILSCGVFLVAGLCNEIHLGQAGFWGIGAYTSALLAMAGVPIWLALLAAIVITAIAGFLVSLTTIKVSGVYLAMVTVGFAEIVRSVLLNWVDLTRGPLGIQDIPFPTLFGISFDSPQKYWFLVITFVFLNGWITYRITNSRLGIAFRAIGNNDLAASAVGVHSFKYKAIALTVCGGMAGLGGSLYAHYIRYIHPDIFTLGQSVIMLIFVILGGRQSILGLVFATVGLTFGLEYLKVLGEYRMLIYAAILILTAIYLPEGIGRAILSMIDSIKKLSRAAFASPKC